jgi:hypothetical protein
VVAVLDIDIVLFSERSLTGAPSVRPTFRSYTYVAQLSTQLCAPPCAACLARRGVEPEHRRLEACGEVISREVVRLRRSVRV